MTKIFFSLACFFASVKILSKSVFIIVKASSLKTIMSAPPVLALSMDLSIDFIWSSTGKLLSAFNAVPFSIPVATAILISLTFPSGAATLTPPKNRAIINIDIYIEAALYGIFLFSFIKSAIYIIVGANQLTSNDIPYVPTTDAN